MELFMVSQGCIYMWNKINESKYELKADNKFVLEYDTTWELKNYYNGKKFLIYAPSTSEALDDAYNIIITRFFADIIKSVKIAHDALELLDSIANSVLEETPEKIVTIMSGEEQEIPLIALAALLKQNCLELLIDSKITNRG